MEEVIELTDDQMKDGTRVMTNRELVAWWNIQQFPGMKVADIEQVEQALRCTEAILTERGIPFERGARTELAA